MAVDKKMMWAFWGLIALVVIGLVLMVVSMFGKSAGKKSSDGSVALTIPDGEVRPVADSKSAAMRGAVSLDQYFGELVPEGEKTEAVEPPEMVSATPTAGSAVERVFGVGVDGLHSDGEHARLPHHARNDRASLPLTQEEKLEYERKRAEMVRAVLMGETPNQFGGCSDKGTTTPADEEHSQGADFGLKPFRCVFVRDERLRSGQRVSLRLLEELSVDGVVVPENTHLQAICKIGERLELQVHAVNVDGRIVSLALEAYDMDGLRGIYCPETAVSRTSRQAREDAVSTVERTLGGLVGDLAQTVLRTGATLVKRISGEKSVSVVSGYEFYLIKVERH